jgi:2-C-methyl-D-erythritol 4-phosphate cytidylyltransferase
MGGVKKPFLELGGEPVLARALRPFLADARVVSIVVALAPGDAAAPPAWLTSLDPRIRVTAGGATRTESVRAGIARLDDELDVIAVHDAARPFLTPDVVARCVDIACGGVGAVAGTPAVDTLKRVDAEGRVVETPPRAAMWHAQTPQVFPADVLRTAYADGAEEGTDDAALVEALGAPVRMVDAGPGNFKVTRPDDLVMAEAMLSRAAGRAP